MAKLKLTKKEKEDFDKLYQYVKNNILQYDNDQALSPDMVMKLHGLRDGNLYHSVKSEPKANYSYEIILMTFQFCSVKIKNVIQNTSFNDEKHKFNTIIKIVRENINDLYLRVKSANKNKDKVDNWEVSNKEINYVSKTSDQKNDCNEEYW